MISRSYIGRWCSSFLFTRVWGSPLASHLQTQVTSWVVRQQPSKSNHSQSHHLTGYHPACQSGFNSSTTQLSVSKSLRACLHACVCSLILGLGHCSCQLSNHAPPYTHAHKSDDKYKLNGQHNSYEVTLFQLREQGYHSETSSLEESRKPVRWNIE